MFFALSNLAAFRTFAADVRSEIILLSTVDRCSLQYLSLSVKCSALHLEYVGRPQLTIVLRCFFLFSLLSPFLLLFFSFLFSFVRVLQRS